MFSNRMQPLSNDCVSRRLAMVAGATLLVTSAHSAAMPFLPELIEARADQMGPLTPAQHLSLLSAAYPGAALLAGPLWGWIADQAGARWLLATLLTGFALTAVAFGSGDLWWLYGTRLAVGAAAAGVVTTAFTIAGRLPGTCRARSRYFALITAAGFVGELVGPLLGEIARMGAPLSPMIVPAGGGLALAVLTLRTPVPAIPPAPSGRNSSIDSPHATLRFLLLLVSVASGAGLATIHMSLMLATQSGELTRPELSWLLTLCGVAMLGAQLVRLRDRKLASHARNLLGPALAIFAMGIVAVAWLGSASLLTGAVVAAAGAAATLRLLVSYLISRLNRHRMGLWLGINQAALSLGQVLAPLAVASSGRADVLYETSLVGFASIALLVAISSERRRSDGRISGGEPTSS